MRVCLGFRKKAGQTRALRCFSHIDHLIRTVVEAAAGPPPVTDGAKRVDT
jgi:hypothetical protein